MNDEFKQTFISQQNATENVLKKQPPSSLGLTRSVRVHKR